VIHNLPLGGGVKPPTERYSLEARRVILGVIFMFKQRSGQKNGTEQKGN